MSDFNASIIDEFRRNDGTVETYGFGRNLALVHNTGARSGAAHIAPLFAPRYRDGWLIVASAAGAPKDPAWAHNLRAAPDVEIEVAAETGGIETVAVTAHEVPDDEHPTAWQHVVNRSAVFDEYQARAGRRIPLFHLVPRAD